MNAKVGSVDSEQQQLRRLDPWSVPAGSAAGIDLPLKMLVCEDYGVTRVAVSLAGHLQRRFDQRGEPQLYAAANAISNFVNAAVTA